MKKFLLFAILVLSFNLVAQTEVRINFGLDLDECSIEVSDSEGNLLPMNDMLVHSHSEISLFLDPGDVYTLMIDDFYLVHIYPIPDTKETLYASISYEEMGYGFATMHTQSDIMFLALKAGNKKSDRKIQRIYKRKIKRSFKP